MDLARLQDRISWGLNVVSRHTGIQTDVFRPHSANDPLSLRNRVVRMTAAFHPAVGPGSPSGRYGSATWHGLFDFSYTRPGDYLVNADGIWFVAEQQAFQPVFCVKTNRTVSIRHPTGVQNVGTTDYGAITVNDISIAMSNWPASVFGAAGAGTPDADLPTDSSVPYWTVLVPAMPNVLISPSDIISDDLGRSAVIAGTELSALGWRLSAKQATA